jgi:hypothetical protein
MSGQDTTPYPQSVAQLLKTYEPSQLRWENPADRWAIVSAVLVRGGVDAREWLGRRLSRAELQQLARQFRGAGLNEPDRAKVRADLGLSEEDIPKRPFLGFRWHDPE